MNALLAHGPTIAQCSAMTFEALLVFIRQPDTINRMSVCLDSLALVAYPKRKVFLSAYMIACHPRRAFDRVGVLETELEQAARTFLTQLESIARNENTDIGAFRVAMHNFYNKFTEWQAVDLPRCLHRIELTLIRLYNVKGRLRAGSPLIALADAVIARLMTKYRRMGGAMRAAIVQAFLEATLRL